MIAVGDITAQREGVLRMCVAGVGSTALLLGLGAERLRYRPDDSGRIPVPVAVAERLGADTVRACRLLEADASAHDLVFVRLPGRRRHR